MITGIISAFVSGILNGSFATPMKRMEKWEWENIWLIWAVWALVIIPFLIAILTAGFGSLYEVSGSTILRTFLLGVGWGLGAITFGLGIYMVGLSLGFSIIMGVTAVTGALVPMLLFNPTVLGDAGGLLILTAMGLTILGIIFCSNAGRLKERSSQKKSLTNGKYSFKLGLIVCISSGILSSMLNLAFVSGGPIIEAAKKQMAGESLVNFRAGNPVWMLILSGAFLTNLIYCGFLLLKKRTIKNYNADGTGIYWLYTFLMGLIWIGGVFFYGAGVCTLGKSGATVSWIILMSTTVLVGNLWGIISGEWKIAPKNAKNSMTLGLMFLLGSIIFVSIGNHIL